MLKLIQLTTWEEIFQDWKQREGIDPGWIHCATVIKGWDSWESWRRFTGEQIGAAEREWNLYEFTEPMSEIPNMLVGPFSGWQSKLPAPNRHTFADLVRMPEQAVPLHAHGKVASLMANFPPSTTFFGLQFPGTKKTIMSELPPIARRATGGRTELFQSKKIVCIEGHHRATAVALAQLEEKQIDFGGSVQIALATLEANESGLLDCVLARGTNRMHE